MSAVNSIPSGYKVNGCGATRESTVGYKQTEVGVIPEDWEVKPLIEVATIATGNTPPTSVSANYGDEYFFVSPADLGEHKYILDAGKKLSQKGFGISRKFPSSSVLFTCIGSTIGKCGIAPIELTSNQQINAIFPDKSFSSEYLYYELSFLSPRIKALAGEQAVPLINKTQFGESPVALPPLPEQRAIATALSDVDALLAAQDKLIAKKRDIKQAAMQQLLTGKQRLPGFSGEWEVKRLGDIATFYKGNGLAKSELDPYGSEPCIHYGELFTRHPETITKILNRTNTTDGVFRSVSNDVLMPTSDVTPNGLARASCVQQAGIVLGGDILVIRANPKELNGSFLSYVIRQLREQVMRLVSGTTVFHLYGADMKKFEFAMPPVDEQQAIVQILDDMDADLAALEQQRDKTRAVKQGMMQELLTGRIRLV